jgi:hypothetical protein
MNFSPHGAVDQEDKMGNEIQPQLNGSLPIRRALTGRDESGKSVFVSFDATPCVIAFETRPGLVF